MHFPIATPAMFDVGDVVYSVDTKALQIDAYRLTAVVGVNGLASAIALTGDMKTWSFSLQPGTFGTFPQAQAKAIELARAKVASLESVTEENILADASSEVA